MNVDHFFLFSKKNHQVLLFTRARLPKKTCFCIPMNLGSAEGSVILFNELPCANVQWQYTEKLIERKKCKRTTTTKRSLDLWDYEQFELNLTFWVSNYYQYFLLSHIAYWDKLFVPLDPVHFLHAGIIVLYHLSIQKLLGRKARNTLDPLKEKQYISKW